MSAVHQISRSDRISHIVALRAPMLSAVERAETRLRDLEEMLRRLDATRRLLVEHIDDQATTSRLQGLDVPTALTAVSDELSGVARLKARFGRNTLNVGVIGQAGQGKSRMLQSLTGLSDREIPSGAHSHCTGSRSTMFHLPEGAPYAEIYYHSEASFLDEVLQPYYRELGLRPVPSSVAEFSDAPLPPIDDTPNHQNHESRTAKYAHLERYRARMRDFRDRLGTPVDRIDPDRIREFVAQDDVAGERNNYLFHSVREARIYTHFPFDELGQVAVIDMPGLGNTGVGDEERMVSVLGHDADALAFVKLPAATRGFWSTSDVELCDLVKHAMPELTVEDWTFLVLNHTGNSAGFGDNIENCEHVVTEVAESRQSFAATIIADCADPSEAREAVLDAILDYLEHRLPELDVQYASACQARVAQLQQSVGDLLAQAQGALGSGASSDREMHFHYLFERRWDELTVGFEGLASRMREMRTKPHEGLKEQAKQCLADAQADTRLPTPEEIREKRDRDGSYQIAFSKLLHRVRTHLARHFDVLDRPLRASLDEARADVAHVLQAAGGLVLQPQ